MQKELKDRVVERARELMFAHAKEIKGFGLEEYDPTTLIFYLLNAGATRLIPQDIEGVPVKWVITGEIVAGSD